jgi:ParB/RepB/Spo0J family partition protein
MANKKENGYGEARMIPVAACHPTLDCSRTINEDSPRFRDLLASVEANGIIQPVIVRPAGDGFDLRAGKRRLRAAQLAGLSQIPAIVLDLDDEAAWRVTYLENVGREDLTPLEQGGVIRQGLERYKGDVRTLAAALGAGWSERRVRIYAALAGLSESWQKHAADQNHYASCWSADHLALIARYDAEVQEEIARAWTHQPIDITLKDLEKMLGDFERRLASAPWDVADSNLVAKAGACVICQHRSSRRPGLFDDQESPVPDGTEKIDRNDRCLVVSCWEEKRRAWLKRKAAELRSKYPDAITLTSHWKDKGGAMSMANPNVKESSKSDKNAVPALVIDGPDSGKVRYVVVDQERIDNQKKAREKVKDSLGSGKSAKTIDEMRAELKTRRAIRFIQVVAEELEESKAPAADFLARMLSVFGANGVAEDLGLGTIKPQDAVKDWDNSRAAGKRQKLWYQVRVSVRVALDELTGFCDVNEDREAIVGMVSEICDGCGIDEKSLWERVAKELPEPAEWHGVGNGDAPAKAGKRTSKAKG